MTAPPPWQGDHDDWSRYGKIVGGLIIGMAAKYGLSIGEGVTLTFRALTSDLLLLGFDGLVAVVICDWFGVTGIFVVLTAALSAVASDRVVRLFRDRFVKGLDTELSKLASVVSGPDIAVVPPGNEPPVTVQIADPRSQSTGEVMTEHLHERKLPLRQDFDDLIDKLDQINGAPKEGEE